MLFFLNKRNLPLLSFALLILIVFVSLVLQKHNSLSEKISVVIPPISKPAVRYPDNIQPSTRKLPPLEAIVDIEGKATKVEANSLGLYNQIIVKPSAKITIKLKGIPKEPISFTMLDGGVLEGDAKTLLMDSEGKIGFEYQVKKDPGSYRVLVAARGERTSFDFWVPPDPARLKASSVSPKNK